VDGGEEMNHTKNAFVALGFICLISVVFFAESCSSDSDVQNYAARVYLVESIPTETDLKRIPGGKFTAEAQIELLNNTQRTLDFTSMYMNLLAEPSAGFTEERLDELGAQSGRNLYNAMRNACERGVRIRLLTSSNEDQFKEARALQEQFPGCLEMRPYMASEWYNSGIMHEKVWISDEKTLYLGSSNTDWLSLTQVKELGLLIVDSPEIAGDAKRQFDAWWEFAAITDIEPLTQKFYSAEFQVERQVPCWSQFLSSEEQCQNPLDQKAFTTIFNAANPMTAYLNNLEGNLFITNAPPEVSGPGRTWDQDGIVDTIYDAREFVDVSVMDFLPQSMYETPPIHWPVFTDALKEVAVNKGLKVRVLLSYWAHTDKAMLPFWRNFQADPAFIGIKGSMEVRVIEIPGWDKTAGEDPEYPPSSRVNHAKYVVTDQRANIGTSNYTWEYFYSTAGTSFNTDHPDIIEGARFVFERDWNSRYTKDISDVMNSQ
jgi:phospholipase D3/4